MTEISAPVSIRKSRPERRSLIKTRDGVWLTASRAGDLTTAVSFPQRNADRAAVADAPAIFLGLRLLDCCTGSGSYGRTCRRFYGNSRRPCRLISEVVATRYVSPANADVRCWLATFVLMWPFVRIVAQPSWPTR
jgi:hypothetical protein